MTSLRRWLNGLDSLSRGIIAGQAMVLVYWSILLDFELPFWTAPTWGLAVGMLGSVAAIADDRRWLGRLACWDPDMRLVRVWRFTFSWRPGAWRRPGEWVFGRQACEMGCIVLDIGWVVVELLRGPHYTDWLEP